MFLKILSCSVYVSSYSLAHVRHVTLQNHVGHDKYYIGHVGHSKFYISYVGHNKFYIGHVGHNKFYIQ